MATHKQFLPKQSQSYGYHWHLPQAQRQAITRYSPTRRHYQLVKCIPSAFEKAIYTPVQESLVVKIQQNRLIWSTDFGPSSRYNESGHISHCAEPHAHVVKAAIKALRKVRELRFHHPAITTIVVATSDVNLVRKAAWKEALEWSLDMRAVRLLYADLETEVRLLERGGCNVLFWLQ